MFFEGIRSERELIETATLNLAHRWYLGYALDEELPDHSILTRIRQRLGINIFERFFEQVVDLCQEQTSCGVCGPGAGNIVHVNSSIRAIADSAIRTCPSAA
jgi:hypothetical protein